MDQHSFPYLHTCEDVFSQLCEYDRVNPLRWLKLIDSFHMDAIHFTFCFRYVKFVLKGWRFFQRLIVRWRATLNFNIEAHTEPKTISAKAYGLA
jgi:hypothetical protein